jgi:ABC-type branched-subunit amino acid transport system permease subunit
VTGNRWTTNLFVLAAILFPLVIKDLYFMHMAILIGIYLVLAVSLNLLLGYSGQLSLGHAAFFGIGAYASALSYLNLGDPWGGMPGVDCIRRAGYIVSNWPSNFAEPISSS